MLILKRSEGARIRLKTSDGYVWITVTKIQSGGVYLGIEAPPAVKVEREEIIEEVVRAEIAADLAALKNGKRSAF
jgi:carbon storage regulator CsrA